MLVTSWSPCIHPKDKGGLGIIDPSTQGIYLSAKWISRAFEGNAPWKSLIRYIIQIAMDSNSWSTIHWNDKTLLAPFFKLHGLAPLNCIWKAWQLVLRKLTWYDHFNRHGTSFTISSIWWSRLIQENNSPLAKISRFKAKRLFKKGIQIFRDLWDSSNFTWKLWPQLK